MDKLAKELIPPPKKPSTNNSEHSVVRGRCLQQGVRDNLSQKKLDFGISSGLIFPSWSTGKDYGLL